MKNKLLIYVFAICTSIGLTSCSEGLDDINENPNSPEVVPTNNIFSGATRSFTDFSRNGFNSGRLTMPWMQYWGQTAYADEDRYLYRETTAQSLYQNSYLVATDLKSVLDINTNEETRVAAAAYGNNDNQIAASRIMLSYVFFELTNFFGDVPYYSYGSDNESFQALRVGETFTPVFAAQEDIYIDILSELRASADMIVTSEPVFNSGDNIFDGDPVKWKKFANSLILRVANNLSEVDPSTANSAIAAAIEDGVMTSNEDNAIQSYGTSQIESSPTWNAFLTRIDFAVAQPFIEVLKGERGVFGLDPRLFRIAAPISATIPEIKDNAYESTPDDLSNYLGVPYAFRNTTALPFTTYSFVGSEVLRPDYGEVLMEYAEVAFILSEYNNFDQTEYENGVRASMEKWDVATEDIESFVADLPPANEANVLNQKYVALYMQSHTAYANYRRTGYPNTLVLPGETIQLPETQVNALSAENRVESYQFIAGPVPAVTDLPTRLRYPQILQTLNGENRSAAAADLEGGDVITSKLFWDVN